MYHLCFLASSIIVSLSTYFISPFISKKISKNISNVYNSLSWNDQCNWNTRYVANLYALIIVPNVFYLLFHNDSPFHENDSTLQLHTFQRKNEHSLAVLCISLGYFISDLIMCIHAKMLDFKIFFHHIIAVSGLLGACLSGWFHYHICFMLIPESTTFFVMNRWWLYKSNLKNTKLYLYNGILMVISWFFARVSIFPLYFVKLYYSSHEIYKELQKIESKADFVLKSFVYFLSFFDAAMMCVLNLIWFYMMIKGAIQMLNNKKNNKKKR